MKDASKQNSSFWDEMCGTAFAEAMNVKSFSKEELSKYDRFFFSHYPYLKSYFPTNHLKNLRVVEFGLGYGSLSEHLATYSKSYLGIDIADGPVKLANHRISQNNLSDTASAYLGNALKMPLENESVDLVTAIGCFHHTGDFQQCINETYRVLAPGGQAIVMVYNRYSLRRWLNWPFSNLCHFLFGTKTEVTESERASYDTNSKGEAAPETEFFSIKEIQVICSKFDSITVDKQNLDNFKIATLRGDLIPTLGRFLGLDLYIHLRKKNN